MMENVFYDQALICLSGHMITGSYRQKVDERENFCPDCGEKTIHLCQKCKHPIKGDKYRRSNKSKIKDEAFYDFYDPDLDCMDPNPEIYLKEGEPELVKTASVPAFCSCCGKAFPWTILRLKNEAEETSLDENEKKILKDLLCRIANDKNNAKAILDEEERKYIWLKNLGEGFWKAVGEILPGILLS